MSYADAKRTVDGLTQGLLNLKLDGRPVAILSGNSIEHALLTMAAMQARLPAAPVSPAYSLMSHDHLKLKYLFGLVKPGVVMVQDGPAFEKALKALDLDGVTVIHVARPCDGVPSVGFADLAATPVTSEVAASVAQITPETVGKLLFTSGSTGMPKAVINTQRMMCANAAMMMQTRPRGPDAPISTVLDWMPWNHTMGGNALFNPLLIEGGRLHLGSIIALIVVICAFVLLDRTIKGFEIRVVGVAPRAARFGGFNANQLVLVTFAISGALAGLAGIIEVAGPIGHLQPGISPGYGFTAIIVAFLGRLNPVGILIAGLFLALTFIGGEQAQITMKIPLDVTKVFQGILLFYVLACDSLILYRFKLVFAARQVQSGAG
ncbi:MAG: AMP-binding protein [Bradyrhizobium sp.]|nr:AMP-binding protein [Bradyrhizobium sp.]